MKTLVTGGAGFIGSHVADNCLKLGHEVVILDNLQGGNLLNIPKKALFIKGSVTNQNLVSSLFKEHRFDYVYHLAAYAAEGLSHHIRRFNYNNNLIGSVNLINESIKHRIKCFIFSSSIAIYGSQPSPLSENTPPKPQDPYGISKYAIELDLQAANHVFGLNYIILRLHNVYGPKQNINDRYRNVIGIFIRQILDGKPLTIFGNGQQTRAFSFITNIASDIANSVNINRAYNETINIGSDKPYSINYIAKVILNEFNAKERIEYLPERFEVLHAYANQERSNSIFGKRKEVEIEEGISLMAGWIKKHSRLEKIRYFKNIEIINKLPAIWNHPSNKDG
ncbi:MAG: NAD-dependent epimerase/dehydratase family protein [Anaerolineales bacterium]|nr:NAD-dependent epimerase/dehydratase family protein [Anaerolineales bacterium]